MPSERLRCIGRQNEPYSFGVSGSGDAKVCMIGSGDWDTIALVEYSDKMALIEMSRSEAYQAIHHHRAAGASRDRSTTPWCSPVRCEA